MIREEIVTAYYLEFDIIIAGWLRPNLEGRNFSRRSLISHLPWMVLPLKGGEMICTRRMWSENSGMSPAEEILLAGKDGTMTVVPPDYLDSSFSWRYPCQSAGPDRRGSKISA
jgi:hypothetical protein